MYLKLLNTSLLSAYNEAVPGNLVELFHALEDAELSTPNFSFYTSVASVFSSKIEGETIELDSYIKHKRDNIPFAPDYTKKTDDLYNAYLFAQQHPLNEENIKKAHALLTKHILDTHWQGTYRTQNMYVATDDGKIEYVAVSPYSLPFEMQVFMEDLKTLLESNLSATETFYFAALLHLVFVKIHPWNDGNGRTARLLEKWFLAQKLGEKAWFIQSEKAYYVQHAIYYENIRMLGLEYESLDYTKALPFLLMLPNSF